MFNKQKTKCAVKGVKQYGCTMLFAVKYFHFASTEPVYMEWLNKTETPVY